MYIFKELVPYTESFIKNKVNANNKEFLDILMRKGIIKYNNSGEIQFVYVGIIIVCNIPIFILPKYIYENEKSKNLEQMKVVVNLLNSFSEREKLEQSHIKDIVEEDYLEDNIISIINYILNDYCENGIYYNEVADNEYNGDGDINWDKTINEISPIVINNRWIYPDLITNVNLKDREQYITLLHATVINDCNDFLNRTGLNEFLNFNIEELDNGGVNLDEIDKIHYELDRELSIQFNDRKKRILHAIKSYLDKKTSHGDANLILYGTKNFKWVWEVICSYVFDNDFVSVDGKSKYEVFGIESPKWTYDNNDIKENSSENEFAMKKNRLTPDILKVHSLNSLKYMLILDAKYYNVKFDGTRLSGNPGIDDITKQYLYHSALKKYIKNNKIDKVINSFIFPTEEETEVKGEVKLEFMKEYSNINIRLFNLKASDAINLYCNEKKYDIGNFIKFIEK